MKEHSGALNDKAGPEAPRKYPDIPHLPPQEPGSTQENSFQELLYPDR